MEKQRYEEIVRRFAGKRLAVVGDLMVDAYVTGQVNRISPESPVMIVEVTGEERVPGGAANVVNNLVALGARAAIVGVVGDDEEGRSLKADLEARGVDVAGILTDVSRPTTIKTRIVAQSRQLLRVDREQARPVSGPVVGGLLDQIGRAMREADAVLISDYNKGVLTPETGSWIVREAHARRLPLAANPKPETTRQLRGADLITLNLAEAERLSGARMAEPAAFQAAGARLAEELDVRALVITQGAKGLTLWQRPKTLPESASLWRGGETEITQYVPAHPVEVYDVAGAGDTCISALTLALISGADIVEAAIVANHAAARVVRKVGVATVSTPELIADWS